MSMKWVCLMHCLFALIGYVCLICVYAVGYMLDLTEYLLGPVDPITGERKMNNTTNDASANANANDNNGNANANANVSSETSVQSSANDSYHRPQYFAARVCPKKKKKG